jgi:hypothetical protein
LARLFKKSYLTNEKELGRSEDGPWDFVGTIRRPGHFPGCYFRSFGAKKLLVPHVGSKVEPAVPHGPRTTREGPQPQHRDPQGGSSEGTQRGDGRRPGRRPLQTAGGSRSGGRYIKRGAAAQQVAVTETGRLSRRRPLQKNKKQGAAQQAAVTETGRLSRRPLQKAGGHYRRPLQEQRPRAGCSNTRGHLLQVCKREFSKKSPPSLKLLGGKSKGENFNFFLLPYKTKTKSNAKWG